MKLKKWVALLSATLVLVSALATFSFATVAADTEFMVTDNGVYVMESINARPVTMEAVIKFPKQDKSGRLGILFGNWVYPQGGHLDYKIESDGNLRIEWGTASTTEKLEFTKVNVFTGEWLHLAVVTDIANQQVHCYIDGELVQSLSTSRTTIPLCANPFAIGNNPRQGNGYNFRGAIKSIALYEDMRSETEIKSDMQSYGKDGLLTHFDMTGLTEGDTLTDTVSGKQVKWEQKWFNSRKPVGEYDYSFAVLGDPQTVTKGSYADTNLPAIYQYVADNVQSRKIQQVFTLGDLTDTKTGKDSEWVSITNAMDILDGVVPHNMVRGNHDESSFYDRYITTDRYGDGVVTMDGTMKNYYRLLKIGTTDYMMLALNYELTDAEREWACKQIETYPNHRVVISTHSFLSQDGSKTSQGSDIWNNIASKYANVVLVLSGHMATENIKVSTTEGVNGNMVTHMLVDQQDVDQPIAGGTGLIAFLYFSDNGTKVEVEYYSPLRNQYYKMTNQVSFTLDTPWDSNIPALEAEGGVTVEPETEFKFSVKGISPMSGGNYTASGESTYAFPATETAIVEYLESKVHFYYSREGVSYKQRDPFTNGDSDGETRWELRQNDFLQRTTNKTSGEAFRKIDSLVPINALGQEIVLKDFETTFRARLENDDYGAVILGFRQQEAGKFTTGYYKFDKNQCFIAISKKGITITGGEDIKAQKNGTGETDYYKHFEHAFDDPSTETEEKLGKNITVTVKVKGNYCDVSVSDTVGNSYTYTDQYLPYTTAGKLAYAVSPITGSIGDISLKGYDEDGNAVDLNNLSGVENTPALLRFDGGKMRVSAIPVADGYRYTLRVKPDENYALDVNALSVTDQNGTPVALTADNAGDYIFETVGGGTVAASFIRGGGSFTAFPCFAADFSELAALVEDGSYTEGVYTSTVNDTAINAWVDVKFGTFLNQEDNVYKTMTHLGQPSDDFGTDSTYTGNVQWQLVKGEGLGITFQNKSGQLMRKSMTLAAKDAQGEYIQLTDFEAEVVFNKAGVNNKVGGVYVSFHEKAPGRASFSGSKTPTANTGDLIIVGNALETYTYQAFGDEISVFAGVHDAADYGVREGEVMTGVDWKLDTDYKLYLKVVDTTLSWSITDLSNNTVIASGSDDVAEGEGTISVGVAGAEHTLKSFEVRQLVKEDQADNTAVVKDTAVSVKAAAGYQLKAGSLMLTDANGNCFVPTRIGYREGGSGAQYAIPAEAEAPYEVSAVFYQSTDKTGANVGLVGTSVNPEKSGLRFVHRLYIDKQQKMVYNKENVSVKEYGLLLAAEMEVSDPAQLTVETAAGNRLVHRLAWPQSGRYFDLCDDYADIAVQIYNIEAYDALDTEIITRAYVMLADGQILYGAPAISTYNQILG